MLRFSAQAWLKLQFLCHLGETEVGAFGVSAEMDMLYVEEVWTVGQRCSMASVKFDDAAVADYFEEQVDRGRSPERFGRVWLHTHPGDSASPSGTDEHTFATVFGACDWAVMFILARGGEVFARLVVRDTRSRLFLERQLSVRVDWASLTADGFAFTPGAWLAEYTAHVRAELDWGFPGTTREAVAADNPFRDTAAWQDAWADVEELYDGEVRDAD